MYAIQGLWTAAHYDLPVVFVICNNAQYRILKSGLLAFRSEPAKQGKFVGMDLVQPEIDFVGLAKSLGVTAERVSKPQEVGPALKQALVSPWPIAALISPLIARCGRYSEVRGAVWQTNPRQRLQTSTISRPRES